eukprot:PhM_4_TR5850/c0_g1_i1/m.75408
MPLIGARPGKHDARHNRVRVSIMVVTDVPERALLGVDFIQRKVRPRAEHKVAAVGGDVHQRDVLREIGVDVVVAHVDHVGTAVVQAVDCPHAHLAGVAHRKDAHVTRERELLAPGHHEVRDLRLQEHIFATLLKDLEKADVIGEGASDGQELAPGGVRMARAHLEGEVLGALASFRHVGLDTPGLAHGDHDAATGTDVHQTDVLREAGLEGAHFPLQVRGAVHTDVVLLREVEGHVRAVVREPGVADGAHRERHVHEVARVRVQAAHAVARGNQDVARRADECEDLLAEALELAHGNGGVARAREVKACVDRRGVVMVVAALGLGCGA